MAVRPVMLLILDGWGIREMEDGNAPKLANTPNYDRWLRTQERSVIDASEEWVGLVPGQMGNSEVGHLNLGAGRVVYQDISRIENAIKQDTLRQMEPLVNAMEHVKRNNSKLHLIGLVSDGGVHSHEDHLYALLDITKAEGINPVIHVITDGRDTPAHSGKGYVEKLEQYIADHNQGRIATVSGRYYAMDRDKRWERTQRAYDAIVHQQADRKSATASAVVQQSYDDGVTDEFILPALVGDQGDLKLEANDVVLFYNFRADRVRQIVEALYLPADQPEGFAGQKVDDVHIVTFTRYMDAEKLPVPVLFDIDIVPNTLSEVISNAGMTQYHSAETEKYPHVTYFFNGRNETLYPGEERKIVPSPKVATYDLKPEMSAYELTEATLERIQNADDDFILVNYANPDMVGHTGSLEAAIKAVETVDECVGKLVQAVNDKGGVAIVTADHGNCDRMIEHATGQPHTYHTINPVGLFVIGSGYYRLRPRGKLADVAPTVLDLLGLDKPQEMTGVSLIDVYVD